MYLLILYIIIYIERKKTNNVDKFMTMHVHTQTHILILMHISIILTHLCLSLL